ncbi:MAG: hypothetical protein IT448_06920 [Phycisphaerales bacterium]|nr:hypothetical protein [Phycisphaerales bacterium]
MSGITGPYLKQLSNGATSPLGALRATRALGSLARWWLSPQVLDLAVQVDPAWRESRQMPLRLGSEPGSCAILFAQPNGSRLSLLRQTFALPLQWQLTDEPNGCKLPLAVRELARQVRQSLASEYGDRVNKCTLKLAAIDHIDQMDLSALDADVLKAESGWAPLAAGLVLLLEGGKPDPRVLATGAWDSAGGLGSVGELQAKINAARELGVSQLFIPEVQYLESLGLDHGALTLVYLPMGVQPAGGSASPSAALRPLLSALEVPPTTGDLPSRLAYYARLNKLDRNKATEFYVGHLLADLIQSCQQRCNQSQETRFDLLVTTASPHWELIPFAIGTFQLRQCVVLRLGEDKLVEQGVEKARQFVARMGLQCAIDVMDIGQTTTLLERGLPPSLGDRSAALKDSPVGWDITPGPKYISLLMQQAARAKDVLLYLGHRYEGRDRLEPGDEEYRIWRVSDFGMPA